MNENWEVLKELLDDALRLGCELRYQTKRDYTGGVFAGYYEVRKAMRTLEKENENETRDT